jgi:hypothetical protein
MRPALGPHGAAGAAVWFKTWGNGISAVPRPQCIEAINHPVRARILAMLRERQASPDEGPTLGCYTNHAPPSTVTIEAVT